MKYIDIPKIDDVFPDFDRLGEFEFHEYQNRLVVQDKIALPLEKVSSLYKKGSIIPIKNENNQIIAHLCLLKDEEVDLVSMSELNYIAYFTEIDLSSLGYKYFFRNNYVIVENGYFDDYIENYLKTSSLWGGFIHREPSEIQIEPLKFDIDEIIAVSEINLPTRFHFENSARAVFQPFAFERFLKLYHLIELFFDQILVNKIRSLGDDLKGIGKIFAEYEREDYERLKMVIKEYCTDIDRLEEPLNKMVSTPAYVNLSKKIFFEFGKEFNPLKDKESKFDIMLSAGEISKENAKRAELISVKERVIDQEYYKLIQNLTTYWIYRIRCSIAHNRISEYVMTTDDEEFVALGCEPLIREAIFQILKKLNSSS